MKRIIIAVVSVMAVVGSCWYMSHKEASAFGPCETVLLYASELPADLPDTTIGPKVTAAGFEMVHKTDIREPECFQPNRPHNMMNITDYARFDLYFPEGAGAGKGAGAGSAEGAGAGTGTGGVKMVVVIPGGGYGIVAAHNEGLCAAKWLNDRGIAAAVVKYRLPNGTPGAPLEDVHNVFKYCRAHAAEWGVGEIGIMGFSAGGHLTATASNIWSCPEERPDFSVLYYPVITFGPLTHEGTRYNLLKGSGHAEGFVEPGITAANIEYYSMENRVSSETPRTFIVATTTDKTVPVENSTMYYNALVRAGVEAEMHIFPFGGHGFGFDETAHIEDFGYARASLSALLEAWLLR